ncbi:MAG: Unknown protein [uncultured Sulfurovum sp.]|uniref:Uncharacterized protein n=1 Tax=uncultured Sulfurovum sp. TaxID=269237 RepID=A0A6S6UK98_9BACT|nr:MAG: Unknown protein [uncultured Sulfurovum sp.]
MKADLKEKLESMVELVDNVMVDPDVDIEYFIPEVITTSTEVKEGELPFIVVKYAEDASLERKIHLHEHHYNQSAQEIANFVTFSVEQFKEEIDSLKYGAQ